MHDRQLLTESDAAKYLTLKPNTLARWRWAGKGPRFIKIGGAIRYDAAELEGFLVAGYRTSTSDSRRERSRA